MFENTLGFSYWESHKTRKVKIQNLLLVIILSFLIINNVLAEDAFEDNDNFQTAATLTLGEHDLEALDDDWFKITSLKPGLLYLKLEHPAIGAANDLNMVLYNSSNQVIAANNSTDQTEELFYHVITSGTYYIRIFRTLNGNNTYTLTATRNFIASSDDIDEGNDHFDAATSISDYNEERSLLVANDEDWYTFLAPAGTFTVTINYDNSGGELDLEVYNSSGNRLNDATGSSGTISGGKKLEVDIADTANITLAVIGRTGASYSLNIDHPVKWMTTLNSGPASLSSPTIADIDGDNKGEIIIGTRPYLDSSNNEINPALLVVLEDDGSVKWTQSFPADSNPDPITGKTYSTSSIATRPAVGDVDGDGQLEIVVGVGADLDFLKPGTTEIYSPGHKGGVYVVDAATGTIEWSVISGDTIGGPTNTGDGLADGVISSPIICDVNQDGTEDIIWSGWDQSVYVAEGKNGSHFAQGLGGFWPVNVHDTNWSTPLCADINDNGLYEILVGGDITENADALTLTGGIFHAFDRWGRDIIEGFRSLIEFTPGSNDFSFLKGKYEEQTVWSSPIAADIDGDGKLEIAYGTGTFKLEPSGNYIRVWNHDGTEYLKLATNGRTFSTPLFADLDGDGDQEIIAATTRGWLHAWSNTGAAIFSTQTFPSGGIGADHPIYSAPLAVDLDGDNDLELVYQQGVSLIIVDHNGNQLTNATKWGMVNEHFRGTPAIGDLDRDGNLEIVTGGTNASSTNGVIYAFKYGTDGNATNYRYARRQFRESGKVAISSAQIARRVEITNFVSRFYTEVLGRTADAWGLSDWANKLMDGDKSGADVARGFVLSTEFINQNTSDNDFLTILYLSFFNRAPDSTGFNLWLSNLQAGTSRNDVLDGFLGAPEFINLSNSFNIAASFQATEGLKRVLVTEFVTRFYNQVLLRAPDGLGLTGWVDSLMQQSKTGKDVASGFVLSQEFIGHGTDNTEFVKVLYRAFFGRSADSGGLSIWVNALNSGSHSREQVLNGFLGSQEFINLATSFGIIPI